MERAHAVVRTGREAPVHHHPRGTSETSLCRPRLARFCQGYGLDLGFGGDKIIPSAIGIDLPSPYTNVGADPVNLGGDAWSLYWFRDGVLDYVYSSHLLEDFAPEDTESVLREWLRVLKPGGRLVLYLPDEQRYRAYCRDHDHPYNRAHKVEQMSLAYIKEVLRRIGQADILHENPDCEAYSFEIVAQKISEGTQPFAGNLPRDAQAAQLLRDMQNSVSWRITKPLRWMKRKALNGFRQSRRRE